MIYFLQPLGGGPIKIGHSVGVKARRRELELHYGRDLVTLAVMDGGRDEEREIHRRFSHLRLGRTEQFRPAPELMAFINRPISGDSGPTDVAAMPVVSGFSIANVKGSEAYRDWLNDLSRKTLIPVAAIVRDAVAKWATDRGLPSAPVDK